MSRGRGLQRPARAWCGDGRCEVVLEHTIHVAHAKRAEDQNPGGDACFSEHHSFFDVSAREDPRARLLQREGDRWRPVAIRIGLDDGDDAGTRAGREDPVAGADLTIV